MKSPAIDNYHVPGYHSREMLLSAVLLGHAGSGLLLLKVGDRYFRHKSGSAKSMGAASVLAGFALLILALAIIWIVRIHHFLR
ncbi:MAG: hypothetical protein WCF74_22125 [Candidatus Sulfotelmatobacter sp.]